MESIQTPSPIFTQLCSRALYFFSCRSLEPTIILISITHPLSAPLRPALAEVRNPLRHPLTLSSQLQLPTALPLHSALYSANTTSASSSARFQTPKHQFPAAQNGPVQRTPRPQKKKPLASQSNSTRQPQGRQICPPNTPPPLQTRHLASAANPFSAAPSAANITNPNPHFRRASKPQEIPQPLTHSASVSRADYRLLKRERESVCV